MRSDLRRRSNADGGLSAPGVRGPECVSNQIVPNREFGFLLDLSSFAARRGGVRMSVLTWPQPFSEGQIEDLFDACNLPESGREEVRRIRTSDPVRRDHSYGNNVCTRFPSRKMGRTIHTASRNCELVAAVGWEHDPCVYEMYDQPGILQLVYERNGKIVHGKTFPDFFLVQAKPPHLCYIECKLDDVLAKLLRENPGRWAQDPNGVVRCPPAEQAVAESGLSYRVWTPRQINISKLRNIRFLADFIGEEISDDIRMRLLELVNRQPGITIEDTLHEIEDANAIYALIVSGELQLNLERDDLRKPELVHLFTDTQSLRVWEAAVESRKPSPSTRNLVGEGNGLNLSELAEAALRNAGPHATEEALERFGVIRDVLDSRCSAKDVAKGGRNAKTRTCRKTRKSSRNRRRARAVRSYEVPLGTVHMWLKAYRVAERNLGCGFVGLIPNWKDSGRRGPRFQEPVYVAMDKVADEVHETPDAPSVKDTYKDFRKDMRATGISVMPCEKTFRSFLKSRNQDRQVQKREGRRARIAQAMWLDDSSEVFAKEGCRPGDVVAIDHTQLDIFIVIRDESGETRVLHLKPWLTLAICLWSRKVLGHSLSLDHPSVEACMEILRDIVRREVGSYRREERKASGGSRR